VNGARRKRKFFGHEFHEFKRKFVEFVAKRLLLLAKDLIVYSAACFFSLSAICFLYFSVGPVARYQIGRSTLLK